MGEVKQTLPYNSTKTNEEKKQRGRRKLNEVTIMYMSHSTGDLPPTFFLRETFYFSFFVKKYLIRIFLFQYDMQNFREMNF